MNAAGMTQIGIDKSHLPQVYDVCQCFSVLEDGALAHSLQEQEIEQFYSSNVQKNQAVQNDVRLARRLQDEEEERVHLTDQLQQLEEQDCEYARVIQEELRRCDEDHQRREEEDEEMAKQLQEEEELKIRQERAEAGYHKDSGDSLLNQGNLTSHTSLQTHRDMITFSLSLSLFLSLSHTFTLRPSYLLLSPVFSLNLCPYFSLLLSLLSFFLSGLGFWQQMMRDAELARRLQEEEDNQPHRRSTETDVDFRTVQVAQDEELARYMQREENRSNRRSHDLLALQRLHDPRCTGRKVPRERLNSEGLHSPVEEEQSLDQPPLIPTCTALHTHPFHNIAEELDPTFTGRKQENRISTGSSSGICLAPRTPHSVFYDYLPEPSIIPPSRRHADKSGRHKPKEKRESCKQQ
ncbi:coiled-coil domain-containing protein 50 isoform X1 [Neoarius graeffei]|uniref:coiled-coil domain-containing protein 50 isoform X1 n=1 Tax=Neoarius graeffei TaxID=443677 RepID=UPI00298CBAAB|nr:coiled-coil domain-containing protein 50 isoform X1 [Neoarius graeffei]XP_060766970.1 coiled-coil domain-containing protein 50 isoform X1 [Neoarius graeffei]XP_060766971.1 coiled-coil domain-containing protein 50 isoform X1 [Neoarius graeffei]XP_060766973.1 coiled-coil domain-containing protein 50 isoform X1 [Neoarius graeffei]